MDSRQETHSSIQEANSAISSYETQTGTRFCVHKTTKNFGLAHDLKNENHKVWFEEQPHLQFNGVPFLVVGIKELHCHRGKKPRSKFNQCHDSGIAMEDGDHDFKAQKKHLRKTKKIGCKAQIIMKDIITFPNYKVESDTVWLRKKASRLLRIDIVSGEAIGVQNIVVVYPSLKDHHNSCLKPVVSLLGETIAEIWGEEDSMSPPPEVPMTTIAGMLAEEDTTSDTSSVAEESATGDNGDQVRKSRPPSSSSYEGEVVEIEKRRLKVEEARLALERGRGETERQRLGVERERLQVERERLELEKQRLALDNSRSMFPVPVLVENSEG